MAMKLKDVLERWAEFACRLAGHKYGKAPTVRVSGHVNATLPYIEGGRRLGAVPRTRERRAATSGGTL